MNTELKASGCLSIICLVLVLMLCFFQAYMESKTYNKLTGAHTTWWDAMWVELRVQEGTK